MKRILTMRLLLTGVVFLGVCHFAVLFLAIGNVMVHGDGGNGLYSMSVADFDTASTWLGWALVGSGAQLVCLAVCLFVACRDRSKRVDAAGGSLCTG